MQFYFYLAKIPIPLMWTSAVQSPRLSAVRSVRIQNERAQRVITSGPYRFVRHPGYTGAIALFIAIPLPLASWWGLLPAAIAIALLVVRTSWEDRPLTAELSGYADYARRTRYRLLPGPW
jgi:protein-S-isoprenylcysteine O-methyltransferase Ste14